MRQWMRIKRLTLAFLILLPVASASAETLADIDAEIQTNKTFKADRGGLAAYNIYEGVTTSRLDRKIAILKAAVVSKWFYQYGSGATNYENFHSFTSLSGVTDTAVALITPSDNLRLYRRGKTGTIETSTRLGAWWSPAYRGVEATRNDLAVLKAWGSDLQRIYVIDLPAGHTLVGGLASPMEQSGEYRPGGGYQYYYNGAQNSWLVYALYAPDYLQSYAGAVTSAQRIGWNMAADVGLQLNRIRWQDGGRAQETTGRKEPASDGVWVRAFGGSSGYTEIDVSSVDARTQGFSIGWHRLAEEDVLRERRSYFGVLLSQGQDRQDYGSQVANRTEATVGGLYGMWIDKPASPRTSYTHLSLLHGGVVWRNSVPGELAGTGLTQDYRGRMTVVSLEHGITFRQHHGWMLEPQLQLSYAAVSHGAFQDNVGALVALRQGDAVGARLGIEARRTLAGADGYQSIYWGRLSYFHRFSPANEVDVSGDKAASEPERQRLELAAGADWRLGRQWYLQGEVAKGISGDGGLRGNLSWKYVW